MSALRVMSYHVDCCSGQGGEPTVDLCAQVIASQSPDLVFLQQVGSRKDPSQLFQLANQLNMKPFGLGQEGACCFLSRHPLRGLQDFSLGEEGSCLRADLDYAGQRLHLFNVCLGTNLLYRKHQINTLLGEELLGNPSLPCAALVAGDFTCHFGELARFVWAVVSSGLNSLSGEPTFQPNFLSGDEIVSIFAAKSVPWLEL